MKRGVNKLVALLGAACLASCASASWYWPFGTDGDEPDMPRLSELMEPATTNIDAAADFAAEGKIKEAQACYRAAIQALRKIEEENPERAATPEFATVRNKRAYINAALDSMLLAEARDNAKAVAVTDTTELEKRLVLKPWKEFLPTYEALTNADRLVMRRLVCVESDWARALVGSVVEPGFRTTCSSNCNAVGMAAAVYVEQRSELNRAIGETVAALSRMERLSGGAANSAGGARVFDVCRQDARKGISICRDIWPRVSKTLDDLVVKLDALHGNLLVIGARRDFPAIAAQYVEYVKGRTQEDAGAMADELGPLRACEKMLGELESVGAGVVHHGVLYRLHAAWGGEETDVPQKEDDRGLVKDESDTRPKVESQIDSYMETERKHNEKVQKAAQAVKIRKDVQKEVKSLLEENPKSRKARMLQAGEDLRCGDTAAALAKVSVLLAEKPNDGPALNMRAAIEASVGDLKAAERTLDQAIQSNPRDYHSYYNMANVYLQKGNVESARRYYETGRAFAGPKNEDLERAVMRK